MKTFLKVILPLVLIVALLVAAGWYFLYERPDLTASALIYWGDRFEAEGRHNRSIFCYSNAMKLQPQDDRIPRWLSSAYAADGNYTKAEYTLVSAITAIPNSVELYCALSRVYVAQDKLLDAENMLGRISSPQVKEQIDALRPLAPSVTPESGYYTDYINVTATANGGTVYLTTGTDFPSLSTDLYEGPFALEAGETNVTAISVGQNGLVSPVVYAGYNVGSVVEEVRLADTVVERCVREQLGKLPDEPLMSDELWEVQELVLPEGVTTMQDLPLFTGLLSLSLHESTSIDSAILLQLTTLRSLDVSGCIIPTAVLEAIGQLPDLTALNLQNCAIDSVNALVGLTKLEYLNLTNNTLSDLTALSSMTRLRELHLDNNPIFTINYLANCTSLEILSVESCGISRLAPLSGCDQLQELYASNNRIDYLDALEGCTGMRILDVSFNKVADISVLAGFPELVTFNGNNNRITAIPDLDENTFKLVQFNANYNQIEDISGLAGLMYLNYVRVDYNKVKDVSCLKNNYSLVQIDAWDNPIDLEPVPEMQALGIIVNYNPTYVPPAEEDTTEE